MYRFIDRPVMALDGHHRFLVAAVRQWTQAARSGRCGCRALMAGFAGWGVMPALSDFGIAMLTLDRDAQRMLRFGAVGAPAVSEDEARVLALFAAAIDGERAQVGRIAAGLVSDDSVQRLVTAVEWVALRLVQGVIAEEGE